MKMYSLRLLRLFASFSVSSFLLNSGGHDTNNIWGVAAFASPRSTRQLKQSKTTTDVTSATITGVGIGKYPGTSLAASVAAQVAPLPEGLVKTVVNGGEPNAAIARRDIVTVKYACYSTGADDSENVLLARSEAQNMVVGDGSMVPGWDAALRSMTVGERAIVRVVDTELGYANKNMIDSRAAAALNALGVDTNTELEFDIEVLSVRPGSEFDDISSMAMRLDKMADLNEERIPTTPAEIAAAYERRMMAKAGEEQLEGLDYWIAKLKSFYFFGLFEGETGEEAPWYLKPSITFPLAFAVVFGLFWISLETGSIREKGAQTVDELDMIVTQTLLLNGVNLPM